MSVGTIELKGTQEYYITYDVEVEGLEEMEAKGFQDLTDKEVLDLLDVITMENQDEKLDDCVRFQAYGAEGEADGYGSCMLDVECSLPDWEGIAQQYARRYEVLKNR